MFNKLKELNILILEAGGDLGLSIVKSIYKFVNKIVCFDVDEDSLLHLKKYKNVAYGKDNYPTYVDYEKDLKKFVKGYPIHIIMPSSDYCYRNINLKNSKRFMNFAVPNEVFYDKEMFESLYRCYTAPYTEGKYPKFAKPKNGVGSRGVKLIYTKEEEEKIKKEYIIQDYIEKHCEYVSDVYAKNGVVQIVTTRMVTRIKGGSDIIVEIVDTDFYLMKVITELSRILGTGCMNVQFIEDKYGERYLIEAHERLSGACIVSTLAGVNYPLILLLQFIDKRDKTNHLENYINSVRVNLGMKIIRYFEEYCY